MPTWSATLALLASWILGLLAWRIQMIGKRRTEIAEEALLAVADAADAIGFIRSAGSTSGEHEAMKKEMGKPLDEKHPSDSFYITLWRMDQQRENFVRLRRIQHLCRYHFGPEADQAIEELYNARHRVWVGAQMGVSLSNEFEMTPDSLKIYHDSQRAIWKTDDRDEISRSIIAAQRKLEAILTPHLRASAAVWPLTTFRRSKDRQ